MSPPSGRLLFALRLAAALVFIVFGIAKFSNHANEVDSFRLYDLPVLSAEAWVYAIGVLEVVGGLLLAAGVLVRPAALALAGDMVGAIVSSGIAHGEIISLTLAPVLLAIMLLLLRFGGGCWSD